MSLVNNGTIFIFSESFSNMSSELCALDDFEGLSASFFFFGEFFHQIIISFGVMLIRFVFIFDISLIFLLVFFSKDDEAFGFRDLSFSGFEHFRFHFNFHFELIDFDLFSSLFLFIFPLFLFVRS